MAGTSIFSNSLTFRILGLLGWRVAASDLNFRTAPVDEPTLV